MPPEPEPAVASEADRDSLLVLALLGTVVGAAAGGGWRNLPAITRPGGQDARRADRRGAWLRARRVVAGFVDVRGRHCPCGLACSSLRATRIRERDPACRGRAERKP